MFGEVPRDQRGALAERRRADLKDCEISFKPATSKGLLGFSSKTKFFRGSNYQMKPFIVRNVAICWKIPVSPMPQGTGWGQSAGKIRSSTANGNPQRLYATLRTCCGDDKVRSLWRHRVAGIRLPVYPEQVTHQRDESKG